MHIVVFTHNNNNNNIWRWQNHPLLAIAEPSSWLDLRCPNQCRFESGLIITPKWNVLYRVENISESYNSTNKHFESSSQKSGWQVYKYIDIFVLSSNFHGSLELCAESHLLLLYSGPLYCLIWHGFLVDTWYCTSCSISFREFNQLKACQSKYTSRVEPNFCAQSPLQSATKMICM